MSRYLVGHNANAQFGLLLNLPPIERIHSGKCACKIVAKTTDKFKPARNLLKKHDHA